MVTQFPTVNPKLQVLEILASVAKDTDDLALQNAIESILNDDNVQVIADTNSIYHKAVWHRVVRFIAYRQNQLGPAIISKIKLRLKSIREGTNVKS